MKILYLSTHEILEYDEIKLFTEIGHDVFSMGVYQNSNQGGELRGEIPNLYQNEQLKNIALQCSKENIHPEIIEWCDVVIMMHNPVLPGSPHAQPWLVKNWDKIKNKRVIWRSIGQSVPHIESELTGYRQKGLQIVRYSPKESTIKNFAGSDATIRFYKDPDEYKDWNGKKQRVINFTQHMKKRGSHCGYEVFMKATKKMKRKVFGPGNDDMGKISGGLLSYDDLKKELRDNRAYFYFGTAPASYTLTLIESMMTGIPIVAAGPSFTRHLYPHQETNEIADLIQSNHNGFWADDIEGIRRALKLLLDDYDTAKDISKRARVTAISLFGKEKIKKEWKDFLEK